MGFLVLVLEQDLSDDNLRALQKMGDVAKDKFYRILETNPEDEVKADGANIDLDSRRERRCFVLMTSTLQISLNLVCFVADMLFACMKLDPLPPTPKQTRPCTMHACFVTVIF